MLNSKKLYEAGGEAALKQKLNKDCTCFQKSQNTGPYVCDASQFKGVVVSSCPAKPESHSGLRLPGYFTFMNMLNPVLRRSVRPEDMCSISTGSGLSGLNISSTTCFNNGL